ncbi:YutD family protein [Lacticaseibacillus saniviri]
MAETEPPKSLDQIDTLIAPETDQRVVVLGKDLLTIDDRRYQLVENYREAFDREALENRYNDILSKYDYIVGDWGYDQLRLRGFYQPGNRHANHDQVITALEDYLYEYCNFGCAYFVLTRLDAPKPKHSRNRRPNRSNKRPAPKEKDNQNTKKAAPHNTKKPAAPKKQSAPTNKKTTKKTGPATTVGQTPRKRHFTIRQRETK